VGYAVTRRLVQTEGAIVVAVARRRVFRVEALAKQVGEDRLVPITADMAAPGQAEALVKQVMDRWGRVDAFVHGVNRALRLSALDVSDTEFDLTMQVNVKSALYGVQAVSPQMRRQERGAVVIYNPTPVRTEEFAASEAVYSAAAHALSALTAGWERQLEAHGVPVREVAPAPDEELQPVARQLQHDLLVVDALRTAFLAPAPSTARLSITSPLNADPSPTVLFSRGGLALTQY
nr:SDR family oxidoreductase [Armatimonadota bacterium]